MYEKQYINTQIAAKLREHRLEARYPWLSRLIDGTYRDKDGSKARLKARATQQRRNAPNKFAEAFSRKMTEVNIYKFYKFMSKKKERKKKEHMYHQNMDMCMCVCSYHSSKPIK
jgi:NAD-dependent SIR2 family protein deacetylase